MTLGEHRPSFLGAGWPWPRDGIRPLSRSAVPSASAPRSAGDPQGWKKFPPADAGRADIARKPRVGAAAHLPEFRAADSAAADPVLTQRAGAPVPVPQPAIGNPTGKACRQHPNANRNLDPHLKSNRFEGFVDAGGTRLLELAQNGQACAWRIAQQACGGLRFGGFHPHGDVADRAAMRPHFGSPPACPRSRARRRLSMQPTCKHNWRC